jgi:hypothetical protein
MDISSYFYYNIKSALLKKASLYENNSCSCKHKLLRIKLILTFKTIHAEIQEFEITAT